MALQMPVYKELKNIEPKVFMGLSWRQWVAASGMLVVGGGAWALCRFVLPLESVSTLVMFVCCMPFAAYGWWRPKGLKPEQYLPYVLRYQTGRRRWFIDGDAQSIRATVKPSIKERSGRR